MSLRLLQKHTSGIAGAGGRGTGSWLSTRPKAAASTGTRYLGKGKGRGGPDTANAVVDDFDLQPPLTPVAEDRHAVGASEPCVVVGLEDAFREAKLETHTQAAQKWCEEEGAAELDEVLQFIDTLANALGLRPLEQRRLARALQNATGEGSGLAGPAANTREAEAALVTAMGSEDIAELKSALTHARPVLGAEHTQCIAAAELLAKWEVGRHAPGLNDILIDTKLEKCCIEAASWCTQNKITTLADVVQQADAFVGSLQLRPLEAKRLLQAIEKTSDQSASYVEVPGLAEVFKDARVPAYIPQAICWCGQHGHQTLGDVVSHVDGLATSLGMKPLELKRFKVVLEAAADAAQGKQLPTQSSTKPTAVESAEPGAAPARCEAGEDSTMVEFNKRLASAEKSVADSREVARLAEEKAQVLEKRLQDAEERAARAEKTVADACEDGEREEAMSKELNSLRTKVEASEERAQAAEDKERKIAKQLEAIKSETAEAALRAQDLEKRALDAESRVQAAEQKAAEKVRFAEEQAAEALDKMHAAQSVASDARDEAQVAGKQAQRAEEELAEAKARERRCEERALAAEQQARDAAAQLKSDQECMRKAEQAAADALEKAVEGKGTEVKDLAKKLSSLEREVTLAVDRACTAEKNFVDAQEKVSIAEKRAAEVLKLAEEDRRAKEKSQQQLLEASESLKLERKLKQQAERSAAEALDRAMSGKDEQLRTAELNLADAEHRAGDALEKALDAENRARAAEEKAASAQQAASEAFQRADAEQVARQEAEQKAAEAAAQSDAATARIASFRMDSKKSEQEREAQVAELAAKLDAAEQEMTKLRKQLQQADTAASVTACKLQAATTKTQAFEDQLGVLSKQVQAAQSEASDAKQKVFDTVARFQAEKEKRDQAEKAVEELKFTLEEKNNQLHDTVGKIETVEREKDAALMRAANAENKAGQAEKAAEECKNKAADGETRLHNIAESLEAIQRERDAALRRAAEAEDKAGQAEEKAALAEQRSVEAHTRADDEQNARKRAQREAAESVLQAKEDAAKAHAARQSAVEIASTSDSVASEALERAKSAESAAAAAVQDVAGALEARSQAERQYAEAVQDAQAVRQALDAMATEKEEHLRAANEKIAALEREIAEATVTASAARERARVAEEKAAALNAEVSSRALESADSTTSKAKPGDAADDFEDAVSEPDEKVARAASDGKESASKDAAAGKPSDEPAKEVIHLAPELVSSLRLVFKEAKLQTLCHAALDWLTEMQIESIGEMLEFYEEFSGALSLKSLQHKRLYRLLQEASETMDASPETCVVDQVGVSHPPQKVSSESHVLPAPNRCFAFHQPCGVELEAPRSLTLRVDSELGAGLDARPTWYGMVACEVEDQPGQPDLLPYDCITTIGGISLRELDPDECEVAFAEALADGVEAIVEPHCEVRAELFNFDATAVDWNAFQADLENFGVDYEVSFEVLHGGQALVMSGSQSAVAAAREGATALLQLLCFPDDV